MNYIFIHFLLKIGLVCLLRYSLATKVAVSQKKTCTLPFSSGFIETQIEFMAAQNGNRQFLAGSTRVFVSEKRPRVLTRLNRYILQSSTESFSNPIRNKTQLLEVFQRYPEL